jgi:hypothetical protein
MNVEGIIFILKAAGRRRGKTERARLCEWKRRAYTRRAA